MRIRPYDGSREVRMRVAQGVDAPYIRGERPLIKIDNGHMRTAMATMPTERREAMEQLLARPPRADVDTELHGRERLPYHGGVVTGGVAARLAELADGA